jgi:PAS domain S-box-containing protein
MSARSGAGDEDVDRYRRLVESVTDYAIYMLDPAGIVSSWNAGAQRFKGYSADEVIGKHFSSFYTEEDRRNGLPARALSMAAGEGKFEGEGWRVKRDGSRFWAHVVIDPIRSPSGELLGFAKITRDLTERRKAEEALRQSEQQFRILVQGVTDYAIYMLSPEGIVTNWNAGAERIKGYRPEEIIGQHFSRFYTDEDRLKGEPARALERARREGRCEREGWRVRKDGTRFWSHVVIDPIRGDDGALIGFAKVTRDITERKQAEASLNQAREALFQSQKMEAIGQLTGGVAHDFNNLLMAVLGSLELLRKRMPDDRQALRLLENAISAAHRGATLTKRMLAFARRQQLDTRPLDVRDLVGNMSELLERSIGSTISIDTRFPRQLPAVMADANQLELALLNLCVNARDAMPDGGSIAIEAAEETVGEVHPTGLPAGAYVRLAVIDTGEGMSEAVLARAAEPFFTTKGIGKGTGLGLSMVHGMLEQMGGRLRLRSRVGAGTTAELWLRAATGAAGAEPPRADAAEPKVPARRLRVLAVDDDALVLLNTTAMLEDLGHSAVEAVSAAAALGILQKEAVDLVITDQSMPRMTGLQLYDAIKELWPDLPVLIATGYAELPGEAPKALVTLNKPFTQRDLDAAIVRILS